MPNLLHGEETRLYGDSAYRGKAQRERLKDIAPKAKDFTNKLLEDEISGEAQFSIDLPEPGSEEASMT